MSLRDEDVQAMGDAVSGAPRLPELSTINQDTFCHAAAAYRPFVMRGLVSQWPALAAARAGPQALADYLLGFDGSLPLDLLVGPPAIGGRFFYRDGLQGFNFERTKVPLRLLVEQLLRLQSTPEPPALYAGAAVAPDAFPGWAEANPLPLNTPGGVPRLWLGNATRASTHYDVSSNIAVVVAGRRRFALFPPEQGRNLYVGPIDVTLAGQPVSLCDLEAPDLSRFPRFADALAAMQVAVLEPGDAIYIPSMWWHDVRASGSFNLLANYWYGQRATTSPFPALVHAILSVRDLPPGERAAVRSWFEQYVFADDAGASFEHIPVAARGVLGAPSPEREQYVRDYLLRALQRAG